MQSQQTVMKTTILNQRAERDELLSRPYQQRHTKYDADELLQNPLIKLITDQLQKLVEVLKNYPSVNLFLGA